MSNARSTQNVWLHATCGLLALAPVCAAADTIDTAGQAPHERCGYCHEADGNPRMDGFPRLAGQTTDYLSKQLRDFRSGRRTGTMNATAELLSDDDIEEVARYFNAQPPRPIPIDLAAAQRHSASRLHREGDAARGIPACGSCHGAAAEGRGDVPRLAGQHAAYLKTQLRAFKRGARANDTGGVMRAVAKHATDAELDALAHYFASLD
ncbi:MAG TPA: c-type cytochrome [Burkholderiaceae bacterium]|nr:c-type cytochrome [Burkholderiaceae bacterium]